MGVKIFGAEVCPLELITDSKTGKLSTSKVWQHIGFTAMTWKFLQIADPSWEILVAYGAIVAGSYVAINLLKWKFRDVPPTIESPTIIEK